MHVMCSAVLCFIIVRWKLLLCEIHISVCLFEIREWKIYHKLKFWNVEKTRHMILPLPTHVKDLELSHPFLVTFSRYWVPHAWSIHSSRYVYQNSRHYWLIFVNVGRHMYEQHPLNRALAGYSLWSTSASNRWIHDGQERSKLQQNW
jgi:hypothetical protein